MKNQNLSIVALSTLFFLLLSCSSMKNIAVEESHFLYYSTCLINNTDNEIYESFLQFPSQDPAKGYIGEYEALGNHHNWKSCRERAASPGIVFCEKIMIDYHNMSQNLYEEDTSAIIIEGNNRGHVKIKAGKYPPPSTKKDLWSPIPSHIENIYVKNVTLTKTGDGLRIRGEFAQRTVSDTCVVLRDWVFDTIPGSLVVRVNLVVQNPSNWNRSFDTIIPNYFNINYAYANKNIVIATDSSDASNGPEYKWFRCKINEYN